jgi:glutaminase
LARSFLFLANGGVVPASGERIVTSRQAKRINAIMLTCGFYDQSGEFAYKVGMPGKSGVGGGVAAVIPGELAIAVWGPELNLRGNSVLGIKALELFTTKTGLSIF